jgi:KDO2-lipid IV(A) lauroyltransferase
VFLGVEKIALKLNNPIVYFSINRIKRGYYECVVKSLIDNPEHTRNTKLQRHILKNLKKIFDFNRNIGYGHIKDGNLVPRI